MFAALERLPFRRKLALTTSLATGLALAVAVSALTAYELVAFRRSMRAELARTTGILAENTAAALSFADPQSAAQTLRSVSTDPHVVSAALYDVGGSLFAAYQRKPSDPTAPSTAPAPGFQQGEQSLSYVSEVVLDGERIGFVYLESDLEAMRARLWLYAGVVTAVTLLAAGVAYFVSRRLHRAVTGPIGRLTGVVSTVAAEKNYSLRAQSESDDEIGRLIEGFNEMLAQIQARDVELHRAQQLLEQRVVERTRELQQEIAERQRSEAALRASNERFEVVTRTTSDVIWDWDLSGDRIWWNENFATVFGEPGGAAVARATDRSARVHPDDYARVEASLHGVLKSAAMSWQCEYRFRRGDGSYAVVFDRACVLRDLSQRPVRMIGAMQDISERRRAEAELASTHRDLLDASRRAGQAEVATSVLHNVGNVLNSVIVSSTVASERLRTARFGNVRLAADLLAENRAALGPFFHEHPKGRLFLPYLQQLGTMLEAEREAALTELGAVVKHIEHIKEIVARQQSYAKTGGVLEKIRLAEVVEHALELNADSLNRHAVTIERAFADVPPFAIDKHRVLQILVNLVRNAKDALKAGTAPGERKLQIEVAEQPGAVAVRVTDNGMGIAPENLTRIFQHGFTTRQDGHGFGLHSGALAARQLGGRLFAQSQGPGRGATFTLEIPFRREDA